MSPRTRATTAIDISSDALSVTVLERVGRTHQARAARHALERKSDPDEQRHHITSTLNDALDDLRAPRDHVAMHLSDHTTNLLTAELPPLKPKDLPDAIHAHLQITIPRNLDALTYRYLETYRDRATVHVLILTTSNEHLDTLQRIARDANLTLVHAQPRLISLAHAYLAFDPEPNTTALLAHLSEHRASLALIRNGALHLARITPSGLTTLTTNPHALNHDINATLELHDPNGTSVITTHITGLPDDHPAITHAASNLRVRYLPPRASNVRFTNDADPATHLCELGLAHAAETTAS